MTEPRLWGFTEEEWRLAHREVPDLAQQFAALFRVLRETPGRGVFGNIGWEAILALARLSASHARRVREQLDAGRADWRERLVSSAPRALAPDQIAELLRLVDLE